MTDGSLAFFSGAALMFCAGMVLLGALDPWYAGYCTAACGSAGVVEVSRKVCTCGPEEAPVAVRVLGGAK